VDQKDNFAINEQESSVRSFQKTNATIAAVGFFITGLSLLVGTIGITNIMYVSVRERTREIGLRKALGARRRMILVQFLLEGVIICLLGGVIAIGLAYAVSGYLARFQALEMSSGVLLVSLVVATATGVLAAFFPAWEAARMPPVEALRSN
jgi:putative ABC transport system permease protein